jgi:hypothetical protein
MKPGDSDLFVRLAGMRKQALMYPNLQAHESRLTFIDDVIGLCRKDAGFAELVNGVLNNYVNEPDPVTFHGVCNHPAHKVRNRMITWYIDHPDAIRE